MTEGDKAPTFFSLIKRLVPTFIRHARRDWLMQRRWKSFEKLPPKEAFKRVYEEGLWGASTDPNDPYFSGSGSHGGAVSHYVEAIERFLMSLPKKPNVVDLGCGDFTVGSRLQPLCARYVACDVVEPLIDRNRQRFSSLEVDFRIVDIASDPLPPGDVVFIRQVLQHLSNEHIQEVVKKLHLYRYVVLTEHVPAGVFTPNLPKPIGPQTRLDSGNRKSGVVLTEPPFNMRPIHSSVICETTDYLGVIRTTLLDFG